MSTRNLTRGAVAVAVAGMLGAGGAGSALAHVDVERTSPRKNKTASRSIQSVSVTFSGQIRRGTMRVTGPGGRVYSIGSGGRDPRRVTRLIVELRSGLPRGSYRASWRIKAGDGHNQKGSFRFRLR
jgi:methionine-rich copper-binding protein CopC